MFFRRPECYGYPRDGDRKTRSCRAGCSERLRPA